MPEPIEFYFDFASPYAYVAVPRLEAIAARHDRDLLWKPIMLGAVFKTTGGLPNMAIPLKGPYLLRDVPRVCRFYGLVYKEPEKMPMIALAASRAFYWLQDRDPAEAIGFAKAIMHAHWGEGRNMDGAENVASVAVPLGIERADLLAALNDPAIKERLKNETQVAIDKGVFGSPFLFVDGEPFWGSDRLDMVDAWLTRGGF
ncbi:MAG: 2-hydroxychromene-2-carboxylate isomerase [Geminicoccaceae bacterium]